jgi:hypothetical protein
MKRKIVQLEDAPNFDTENMRYPDEFYRVMMLREKYGDVTLGSILGKYKPFGFKCPQCDGTGKVEERYATDMLAVATGCAEWWQQKDFRRVGRKARNSRCKVKLYLHT